jgi:CheY-like chemotaxis protein
MSDNGPLKIYVVDDDAQIVEFMAVSLEAAGHTMFADISAVFAISRIVEKKPDSLITDLMMSVLDGIELCKLLRQRPELKDLVVIFVSAQGSDYWKQRAREAGADGYIVKPLLADTFVQEVESVIPAAKDGPGAGRIAAPTGNLPGRR